MNNEYIKIKDGIFLFNGKLPRNLLFEPIVSNLYFLDDGEEATVFDPSCGKKIAKRVEGFIQTRGPWNKATLIAGHSHIDHANNFYLSDVIDAPETSIYVHENGFKDGKVMNDPRPFIENGVQESMKYYNYYLSFPFPYNLLMSFFVVLDAFSPALARKIFAITGCMPWPAPKDGSVKPMALKDTNREAINIGPLNLQGWKIRNKFIIPTPGHSPCSVSLYWPEMKSLFISDADWVGNPVFMTSSIKNSIASLNLMRELTETGYVDLLLPAHGDIKQGREAILRHLRLRISLLEVIRDEIISAYRIHGEENNVRKLTKILTQDYPLFKLLKILNYPRSVFFVHNTVAVCLKEEGLLT